MISGSACLHCRLGFYFVLVVLLCSPAANAQGTAPETAPPIFPGGGLLSYSSVITTYQQVQEVSGKVPAAARPSFFHQGDFIFTWGFHPDFDLTIVVPIVTTRFQVHGSPTLGGGTGLGDAMVVARYRFYRKDSPRGTTQASVTVGPKLPTGKTDLTDLTGVRLPAGLQPGTGSTDVFVAANWTYTGLFNLKRLVADEDFHSLLRSEGTQAAKLGHEIESRFWLSYRPYEAANGQREWFIGPAVTWLHSQDDQVSGFTLNGSGGDALLTGITSYFSPRPGLHLWLGMDWDVAHSTGALFMPVRRHISFGLTQQFRLHL